MPRSSDQVARVAYLLTEWDEGSIDSETLAEGFLAVVDTETVIAEPDQIRAVASWQLKNLQWMRSVTYPVGGIRPVWGPWHLWSGQRQPVGGTGIEFMPRCNRRGMDARPRMQSPCQRVEFGQAPDEREGICDKCLSLAGERTVVQGGW